MNDLQVMTDTTTILLWHSQFAMERSTQLLIGKPFISITAIFHGYVKSTEGI